MRIFGLNISRGERRMTSSEFESAVNKALTADMVADKTSRPAITQESSLALTAVWACVRILSETVGT
jgi:phage portal protein BeeE